MKTKLFTMIIILVGMVMISFSAKAEEYGKTFKVTPENAVLNVKNFVLYSAGTGGFTMSNTNHIVVKNGMDFYIQLPKGHNVSDISPEGRLEGDRIRVVKAGSLSFDVTIDKMEYSILAHVNYYGVLQYQGKDLKSPDTIVIKEDKDLDSILSIPDPSNKFVKNWLLYFENGEFLVLHGNDDFTITTMSLSDIVAKAKAKYPDSNKWVLRMQFDDGTSNETFDAPDQFITIKDERVVLEPPTITTSSLPEGKEGVGYRVQLEATGTAPITWSLHSGNLPSGLVLSESGLLSGTPTEFGTFNFTVKATNTGGSAQKEFTLVLAEKEPVVEVPTIRTSSLPKGKEGESYSVQLEATGTAPITWSLHSGNLPSGLVLSESGLLSGTPTEFGTFTFTVKAKNAGGSAQKDFTLMITEKIIAPTITTSSLPEGKEGESYHKELKATGTAPITWSIVSGSLPAGLSLSSDGLLSGTPTEFGTFTFTVKAKNAGGENEKEFTLMITEKIIAPTITTSSLPEGKEGESYSQKLEATGTAPITWSIVSGSLPAGLSLSSDGLLSGTPTEFGTFTFTVKATNEGGSAQKDFTLVIAEKEPVVEVPTIRTSSLPEGKEGVGYREKLEAIGTAPITWSIVSGSLPVGLSLSSDGLLSGTPTEFGTFTFTVRAKNAGGENEKEFFLTINKNTGIESLYQDEKIFVADGILQVMLSESGILSVYSLSGELILQKDFNYEVEVLLPHNNQIFILSIKTPTRSIYDKVIK